MPPDFAPSYFSIIFLLLSNHTIPHSVKGTGTYYSNPNLWLLQYKYAIVTEHRNLQEFIRTKNFFI